MAYKLDWMSWGKIGGLAAVVAILLSFAGLRSDLIATGWAMAGVPFLGLIVATLAQWIVGGAIIDWAKIGNRTFAILGAGVVGWFVFSILALAAVISLPGYTWDFVTTIWSLVIAVLFAVVAGWAEKKYM